MNTYARYWDRIMRLIEEGRFKREKGRFKYGASRHLLPQKSAPSKLENNERAVYDSWKKAQRELGRSSDVDFERQKKLEKQRQAQKAKYGWDDVSYSVG